MTGLARSSQGCPKWSITSAYAQHHLVGEISCNGGSQMVQGAIDAQVEVVEGQSKEIKSRWEFWPQIVNTEHRQSLLPGERNW